MFPSSSDLFKYAGKLITMSNNKRIMRDLRSIQNDMARNTSVGITLVDPEMNNLHHFQVIINGPKETPYEGGKFLLDVTVGDGYPFKPPSIQFLTKLWHPNVEKSTGIICVDVLKQSWRSGMTLGSAFLSVQSLLETPEPKSPLNCDAGTQMQENKGLFETTAMMWTHILAEGPKYEEKSMQKVNSLREMGIGADDFCRLCLLSSNAWDVEKAVDSVLSASSLNEDILELPE